VPGERTRCTTFQFPSGVLRKEARWRGVSKDERSAQMEAIRAQALVKVKKKV
jgi:hypothetical protein